MGKLPKFHDDNLLVGIETSDDAAIYKVTDDIALIQTVDFFTPIVDDPYMFGQIAAANSLSDVYAMGGEPKIALNIVGFPNCLDPSVLGEILAGGADIPCRTMSQNTAYVCPALYILIKSLKITAVKSEMFLF